METTEVGDKLMHYQVILVVKCAFVCCCCCTRVSKCIWNKCLIFEVSVTKLGCFHLKKNVPQ